MPVPVPESSVSPDARPSRSQRLRALRVRGRWMDLDDASDLVDAEPFA